MVASFGDSDAVGFGGWLSSSRCSGLSALFDTAASDDGRSAMLRLVAVESDNWSTRREVD